MNFIASVPTDKRIGSVHCVPVLDSGNLVMVWDSEEKVLTTIGGRLENNESLYDGLNREVIKQILKRTSLKKDFPGNLC